MLNRPITETAGKILRLRLNYEALAPQLVSGKAHEIPGEFQINGQSLAFVQGATTRLPSARKRPSPRLTLTCGLEE